MYRSINYFTAFFFFLLLASNTAFAQFVATDITNPGVTAQTLVQNNLVGTGISVSNITTNIGLGADARQFARFTNVNSNLPITQGIMLSTGFTQDFNGIATNIDPGFTSTLPNPPITCINGGVCGPGDADLNALIAPNTTNDAAVLEFDFVPLSDTIRFRYVFASEEYPEYVCDQFNDAFAFFLTGPGFPTATNLAIIPGSAPPLPVTINSVNPGAPGPTGTVLNCSPPNGSLAFANLYVNNTLGAFIEFDGMTVVLEAVAVVVPCSTYHIKLAIGDAFDGSFDSAVFFEAGSFSSTALDIQTIRNRQDSLIVEGCGDDLLVTLTLPDGPTATVYPIPLDIFGTATNGVDYNTLPDTVFINPGDSVATFVISAIADGLPEGTESVFIGIQKSACQIDTLEYFIIDGSAVTANASVTSNYNGEDVSCRDSCDAIVTAVGAGGVISSGNYSYQWGTGANSQTTAAANGLCDGVYQVIITDDNLCSDTTFVTVTEPSTSVDVSVTNITNVTCGTPGAITALGVGGTGAISYQWDVGASNQITPTATNLNAGTYLVTVSDDNGCIDTISATVTGVNTATITLDSTDNTSCNGSADGNAYMSSSGTGLLTYLWSDGQTVEDAVGLSANIYTVTITDANNCTATTSVTISEPSAVTATATSSNVSCNGSSDGIARAFGSGGTGAYSFLWDANAGNQVTPFVTGLSSNTYCVTVTDANGCVDDTCVVVNQNTQTFSVLTNDTTICEGDTVALSATSADAYAWSPNINLSDSTIQNPIAFPTSNITYIATADILSGVNIIYNGDFSDGNVGFTSTYTVGTGGTFGQLSNPGTYAINTNASNTHNNFAPCTDHTSSTGDFMVVNGATTANQSVWCQTVNVTPNTDYQFSTWVTSVVSNNPTTLQFSINGVNLGSTFNASATTCVWNQFFTTWNSGGNTTATICIVNQNTQASGNDFGLDDIEFVPICKLVDSVVVNVNPAPTITFNNNTPVCENSSVAVSANGGLNYSWTGPNGFTSNSSNINIANATVAADSGNYIVTVTTALGCSDTASTAIIVNPNPTVPIVAADVLCNGNSDGTATATGIGGLAPYSYVWNTIPVQNTGTATGLSIGQYIVTVTDANGCIGSDTTQINEPTILAATVVAAPTLCNGSSDGTGTATVTGGIVPYSYDWGLGGVTSATSQGLAAGNYVVTVTDDNNCSTTVSFIITQPAAIAYTITVTDVSCNGGSDGAATVTPTGGAGAYTYLWNNAQTNATATNLSAGQYCVTITDGNGCTEDTCLTVGEPAGFSNITFVGQQVSCNGGSDGQLTVSVQGGISPYSYSWSTGATNATATNLNATTHTVTITDFNGCTISDNATITEPALLQVILNADSVSCNGGSDGQISAITTGGIFPYTYAWSNGQNSVIAGNLTAGVYTVTVTDFNGCTVASASADGVVGQPATPLTASIINSQDPSCNGFTDGSIEVDAQGATPNYTYVWDNGNTSSIATNVGAGPHNVTVTDANGCTITASGVLNEPSAIVLTTQILSNYNGAAISCVGEQDGSVGVVAAGGSSGYSYQWSPTGANTATISNLGAGTYDVTVTDIAGCSVDTSIAIADPVQLAATFTQVDILCNGDANGQILANATPGTGTLGVNGYEYKLVGPGQIGNVFSSLNNWSNLDAGTYIVHVRDGNNCEIQLNVNISEPDSVLIDSVTITAVLCHGDATGTAMAYARGGVLPYSYNWSHDASQTNQTATGLALGVYSVTVIDGNGCDRVEVFNMTEPTPLVGAINADTIACNGGVANATASASGGTTIGLTGYLYNWDNGTTAATAVNLSAGVHCVTITDGNGCTEVVCVTMTEPSTAISASITSQTDALCSGTATGTATAQGSGGTAPYTYNWQTTPAQTSATADSLAAGIYNVIVTDVNGCNTTISVTISQASSLNVIVSSTTDASCHNTTDGSATALASGGTSPYTYNWGSGNSSNGTINNLSPGVQTVIVTDGNGCTASAATNINAPTPIQITNVLTTNVLCVGDQTGTAIVSSNGGTPTTGYSYSWSTGATTQNVSGLGAGAVSVTVSDANGCQSDTTVIISEPAQALNGYVNTTPSLCSGQSSGELTAVIGGGISPYSYAWSNGATNVTADSLASGSYNVTVSDANGCTYVLSQTVGEATTVQVTASVIQDVSCNGGNNGQALASSATGGTSPYTYVWTDPSGQTGQVATSLSAGAVSVIATDINGCTASSSVTLTEGSAISLNTAITNVSCNGGSDGQLNVLSSNKTIINYIWSNGSVGNPNTGLSANDYSVTVTDNAGCQDSFEYTVTEPTALALGIAQTTPINCHGEQSGRATVSATGGSPNYSYAWSPTGGNAAQSSGIGAGTYTVTVTDSKGCTADTSISISEPAALTLSGSSTSVLCAGDANGTISVVGTGGTVVVGNLEYSVDQLNWQTGTIFQDLLAGSYTVSVRDENGCQTDTTLVVADADSFEIVSITADTEIEYLDSLSLDVSLSALTGVTYVWTDLTNDSILTDSSLTYIVSPGNQTTYQFMATDSNGCQTMDEVQVTVTKPRRANAPQAFTPNGDGVNDWFFIQGGDKVEQVTSLKVYDRWGELVFSGVDSDINVPEQGWDGNFRGQPSTSGSYIWHAEVLFKDGRTEAIQGDVILLR